MWRWAAGSTSLYHFAIQQVTCKYGKFVIDLIYAVTHLRAPLSRKTHSSGEETTIVGLPGVPPCCVHSSPLLVSRWCQWIFAVDPHAQVIRRHGIRRALKRPPGTRFLWCSAHGDHASVLHRGVSRPLSLKMHVGPTPSEPGPFANPAFSAGLTLLALNPSDW